MQCNGSSVTKECKVMEQRDSRSCRGMAQRGSRSAVNGAAWTKDC